MKILAVDTATEACSVALLLGEQSFGMFEICPQQHSQRVLPMIDELLKKHGVKLKDLDAIAYGRGPGSFTGVRIAAGMAQGLAFGVDLPVVEVSTLAAMAQETFEKTGNKNIRVLIDARMGEVYFGDYEVVNGLARERQDEAVLSPLDALAKFIKVVDTNDAWEAAGTGWQAYATELDFGGIVQISYPNAMAMLSFAKDAMIQGKSIKAEQIQPTYVRDNVTWKKLPGKE